MRYWCIFNPVSGRGAGAAVAARLQTALQAAGYVVELLQTEPDLHVFRARCQVIQPEDRMVVIGGDGTFRHVLNAAPANAGFAFFGMGTANVITIEFNLPRTVEAFTAMIVAGHTRRLYPGQTDNGSLFTMMYSFGLDAAVIRDVPQSLKNRIGKAAFAYALVRSLLTYTYPSVTLELDDGRRCPATWALITRFRHYGGAYQVAPEVDHGQRRLVVLAVPEKRRRTMVRLLWRTWRGTAHLDPGLKRFECSKVSLHVDQQPPPGQLDGDLFPVLVRSIEVAAQPIELIVPPPA